MSGIIRLIDEFLEDLHGHRGKNQIEMIVYIVELEEKWETKKESLISRKVL